MKDYEINGYSVDEYVNNKEKDAYYKGLISGIIITILVIAIIRLSMIYSNM